MELKFKQLYDGARLPERMHRYDAGLDLYSSQDTRVDRSSSFITIRTGLAVEIPNDHVGLIFPRSSTFSKWSIIQANSVSVIDSNYRGEIVIPYFVIGPADGLGDTVIPQHTRIAQLVIIPYPYFIPIWANTLSASERGEKGFGSTGE
jgi:dUTP pyrophosphatase